MSAKQVHREVSLLKPNAHLLAEVETWNDLDGRVADVALGHASQRFGEHGPASHSCSFNFPMPIS